MAMKKNEQAVDAYRKALELDPNCKVNDNKNSVNHV